MSTCLPSKIHEVQTGSGFHPVSCSMCTRVLSEMGLGQRPGCEFEQSLPYSVEVNNQWSYTSGPPTCFPGEDRDNFIFRSNKWPFCRYRWPRGLRCRSAAARLLGLRVRIPPGMLCVLQVEVSESVRFFVQGSPTKCVCH